MNKSINKLQSKRLQEKSLAFEEYYTKIQGNHKKEYVRSSDVELEYNIINCSRQDKRFFRGNKCIYVENDYDKSVLYTFIAPSKSQETMSCPNCGHSSTREDFNDGCPYCGTHFNMSYNKGQTNSSPFEFIFSGKFFKKFTMIFTIIYLLITIFRIWYTFSYDNEPEAILNLVFTIPFGFFMLYFMAYFAVSSVLLITFPLILIAMESHNSVEKFWDRLLKRGIKIDKIRFINDLNDSICDYYYNAEKAPNYKDLVDFDIIRYNKLDYYQKGSDEFIVVDFKMRKFFYRNNKIKKHTNIVRIEMIKDKSYIANKKDYQVINCPSCGASVNLRDEVCGYCNTKVNAKNEWVINRVIWD